MRIQQLHYIIKIVETGSMNEAAKQLFITQPSLSNAVRDLEREMGIDIFIRNPKGITLTKDGVEFLSYARQVVEQTNLLEERYKSHTETRELFSVSSQHYAFVVNAFVSLLKRADMTRYELFLRETRTYEIIEDVKNFRSEIGVLFLNSYNRDVLTKMFDDNRLTYTSLFKARPHIFVSKSNPLAKHEVVSLEDLEDWLYCFLLPAFCKRIYKMSACLLFFSCVLFLHLYGLYYRHPHKALNNLNILRAGLKLLYQELLQAMFLNFLPRWMDTFPAENERIFLDHMHKRYGFGKK